MSVGSVLNAGFDTVVTLGLSGVEDSLAYEVVEGVTHFHSIGHIYGKDGDGFMIEDGLTAWQITAGAGGAYGNWLQIDDGTGVVYGTKYDPHQILITQASAAGKIYYIQFGIGNAGSQTVVGAATNLPAATLRQGPAEVQAVRVDNTEKLWARCKCETDSATTSFILEVHCYGG